MRSNPRKERCGLNFGGRKPVTAGETTTPRFSIFIAKAYPKTLLSRKKQAIEAFTTQPLARLKKRLSFVQDVQHFNARGWPSTIVTSISLSGFSIGYVRADYLSMESLIVYQHEAPRGKNGMMFITEGAKGEIISVWD